MPRPALGPTGCGTDNGYQAHNRNRTVPCGPCLIAHTVYTQARKRIGRCAAGLGWPLGPVRGTRG
jgi:hypothetical protein